MYTRVRLLQVGFVLALATTVVVLALPTVSDAQLRPFVPTTPPAPAFRKNINPIGNGPPVAPNGWGMYQPQNPLAFGFAGQLAASGNAGAFGYLGTNSGLNPGEAGVFGSTGQLGLVAQLGGVGQIGIQGQVGQAGQVGQVGSVGAIGTLGVGGQIGQIGAGGALGQLGKQLGFSGATGD